MPYGTVNADLITTSDGVSSAGLYGFKNKIINGSMQIDQRNAGASVTVGGAVATYTLDRFAAYATQASKFSVQQNAASVTPPVGFTNYLGATSSSAYSVLTGDYFGVYQNIEGLNTSDLAFGTASAATVTLSFWVRSSLTGTFGGSLLNSGYTRSYPFIYSISSANTWEQKTITITGDTSGTWLTTNGVGIRVWFSLGTGATYSGTAGGWSGSSSFAPTGATSVVGTNGATLYITGVQLEKGSTATSFDYRPYGTELQLCQRYYWQSTPNTYSAIGSGLANGTTGALVYIKYPVSMRSLPTFTVANSPLVVFTGSSAVISAIANQFAGYDSSRVDFTTSGLTAGQGVVVQGNNSTAYVSASAEL